MIFHLSATHEPPAGIRKIVGQRIAQKRDQAGLTQEQVADRIALGREAYARYERGTADVSLGKLIKIAAVFKCSVEELVVETSTVPRRRPST